MAYKKPKIPDNRTYDVLITKKAKEMLGQISDQRIKKEVWDAARGLVTDPHKKGKPLVGELQGYRSLRVSNQRYRIIYTVQDDKVIVLIVAIGMRKQGDKGDIYKLAQKLLELGLLKNT